MTEQEQIFIDDSADYFASIEAGKPFRLFKYGPIYKDGKKHVITKDYKFNLPHFKPPIKLGSHKEETPSGGSIKELDYRDDGIYAVPELNPQGIEYWNKKAFRYHSPEVVWENGYYENPNNGEKIQGPLIVGLALTHTPHLGEQTALYTYSVEENNMSELTEVVEKNTNVIEKFMSLFEKQPEQPEPDNQIDEFEALQKEKDELAAKVEKYEAEQKHAELLTAIKAEFETDEYGAAFQGLAEDADMLATMNEDQRKYVLDAFKALSAQINESALMGEQGEDDPLPQGGVEAFDAAVIAYAKEHEIKYNEAVAIVAQKQPELYAAYKGGK